jgi:hypothetical protein
MYRSDKLLLSRQLLEPGGKAQQTVDHGLGHGGFGHFPILGRSRTKLVNRLD